MARDGYRIFDSDTHVGPDARILAGYLSEAEKDRLSSWEAYKSKDRSGHETYTKGQRRYRRRLGTAEPDEAPSGYMAGFTGVRRTRQPSPLVDSDPGERIKDMDHEGVDVNLTLPSGWFGTWTASDDVALEMAMYRAYHRWMADYCCAYPTRLGGVILVGARDIDGALEEIRRWGQASWAWGLMVYAPVGMPLDHPTLEPLYAAAAELDLAVVLHTDRQRSRLRPCAGGDFAGCVQPRAHRWYYFSDMQPDEALFRVHDSANDGRARLSFHTSFDNPLTPGAPPRESMAVRTVMCFPPAV
jgi:Amidohydrolase